MQDTLLAQLNAREAELGYGGWDLRHKKQVVISYMSRKRAPLSSAEVLVYQFSLF